MQQTQLKVGAMGSRVQGFLTAHATELGVTLPPDLRTKLDAAMAQLTAAQAEQGAAEDAAKTATATQKAIRKDMNDRLLRPIARVAKADLKGAPDFDALIVPAGSMAKGVFVSRLNRLADAAVNHEKEFLARLLPTDFIAQLRAAAAQFSATSDSHDRSMSRRTAATSAIAAAERVIREEVAVLNRTLPPHLKSNPALLADWVASSKIQQTTVNPISTGNATPGVPTADPTQQQPAAAPVVPAAPASPKAS
jgi:hypothetical protein